MRLGIDDADESDEGLRLDPLAEELRSRRQALGWTQERLARQIGCSESLIAHWEAGRRTPSIQNCKLLDQALNTGGVFERFRSDKPFAPHFDKAAKAEQRAVRIEEFSPVFVPGLLQTPDYAREVFKGGRLRSPQDELDKKVVRRIARGKILHDAAVESLFIVSETVLLLNVGGPNVMADQLAQLRKLVSKGTTSIQVVPHAQGNQGAATSTLCLMRFADQPPMAYVEGLFTGVCLESPDQYEAARDRYDMARSAALSLDHSMHFILKYEERWANAARSDQRGLAEVQLL